MSAFNYKVLANKDAYTNARCEQMDPSLEAAFNRMLSRFTSVQKDERYDDGLHYILTNDEGEEYYFDSFKYIYPRKDTGNLEALHNNVGKGQFRKAYIIGDLVVIERYDVEDESAVIELVRLTDDTIKIMKEASLSKGELLLQLCGHLNGYLASTDRIQSLNITRDYESDMLICTDRNGNIIEQIPIAHQKSFYEDCSTGLDYFSLLNLPPRQIHQK